MSTLKTLALAGLCLAAASASTRALAQSTDGYHAIQVFPVVVDTAAFTQRFTFRNPDATNAISIAVKYLPGAGTTQAAALDCPAVAVAANSQVVVASLRALCPALAAGSQYGYVYTSEANATRKRPYAAYSRVSNAAGIGFSVEAFPGHTFTSADGVVTGVRRLAAAAGAPAYQTNCFVGKMPTIRPLGNPTPAASTVRVSVYDAAGAKLGTSTDVVVAAGSITRMLDVFAAVGAPAGNHNDARVVFEEIDEDGEPGLLNFCTVQDNTSFGADFRIAKQERGQSEYALTQVPAAQDEHVQRDSSANRDVFMFGQSAPRLFTVQSGATGSNTHVIYFRHPDYVQCELIDPATNLRPLPAYGLEMRMVDQQGFVIAGGTDVVFFNSLYLGDKASRNSGANTRYTIDVEASTNTTTARPYRLHCVSGSGHTLGDMVRFNEAVDRF